jgi:hypothetical protein
VLVVTREQKHKLENVLREKMGKIQDDSNLFSEFPFIGHGNPDSNL